MRKWLTPFQEGFKMGQRHATTGAPDDYSDARCLPLEAERDNRARELAPNHPFGHPQFHSGYEAGYDATAAAKVANRKDEQ